MFCEHGAIAYSVETSYFKCLKCGENLIKVDFEIYKIFCHLAGIPFTKMLER